MFGVEIWEKVHEQNREIGVEYVLNRFTKLSFYMFASLIWQKFVIMCVQSVDGAHVCMVKKMCTCVWLTI